MNYEFDTKDLVCLALSSVVGVWYLLRKVRHSWGLAWIGHDPHGNESMQGGGSMHSGIQISFSCPSQHWIANNLFGLAFSLNGVELLHLNNVSTGCILLGGLFIYDVFWVSRSILQAVGGNVCLAFCPSGGTTLAGHKLEVGIFTFSAQRGVAGLMTESTAAECGSSSAFSSIL